MSKYNQAVRRAISDMYVQRSKEKASTMDELRVILKELNEEKDIIPYNDYCNKLKRKEELEQHIQNLEIEINVWDQAREICLDIADEM